MFFYRPAVKKCLRCPATVGQGEAPLCAKCREKEARKRRNK